MRLRQRFDQVLSFTLSPSDDESRLTTGLCAPNRLLDDLGTGPASALFDEVRERLVHNEGVIM